MDKFSTKGFIYTMLALIMLPFTCSYFFFALFLKKDNVFSSYSQLISLFPGKLGALLRSAFYRFTAEKCEPNVLIGFGTIMSQRSIQIGKNTYIGPQCNLGSCSIGIDTLLGSGVHILSGKGQHNFNDLKTPIKDQGGTFEQVKVGRDCWLGNGAIVMANIGNHSVVAAGSVVINDVPEYAVVAGNPAKVIKMRK